MITRDGPAAGPGRSRVIDYRAALAGVIRHAHVGWTGEAAIRLAFKGSDIGAIAAPRVGDARVIELARAPALIEQGAGRHARVDRGTTGQKLHRLGRAAIVRQRRQHRVRTYLVPGAGEA